VRRCAFFLIVLGTLPACGGRGAIPEVDLLVTVSVGKTQVHIGEGFPVTVTRVWRKDIEPSPWDDGVLSPLVVRARGVKRREDRLRVEETRTFRGHAFTLQDVTIPPVLLVGRSIGGSGKLVTRSAAVPLTVMPVLDPQAPGPPELPDAPQPRRPAWPTILLASLLALGLAGVFVRRRFAHRSSYAPRDESESGRFTEEQALSQLEALRAASPTTDDERRTDRAAVAAVIRAYVAERFSIPAEVRTSEELVASASAARQDMLRCVLVPCDRVKFAAHMPSDGERVRGIEQAAAFVRACGRGAA